MGSSIQSRVTFWSVGSTPDRRGPGSSPGRGHCVVFLGKIFYFHSASLHPVVYKMGTADLGQPEK